MSPSEKAAGRRAEDAALRRAKQSASTAGVRKMLFLRSIAQETIKKKRRLAKQTVASLSNSKL
jgi:hypothetical protein